MTGDESDRGNRTVYRPSPLQGQGQGQAGAEADIFGTARENGASPGQDRPGTSSASHTRESSARASSRMRVVEDDIPLPPTTQLVRNRLLAEAGPILALAASLKAGRARIPMIQFHIQATEAIKTFDSAIAHYPEAVRYDAKYALCATLDDIAQNLPGSENDAAQWARRSMVLQTFLENIGGDRLWKRAIEMLSQPKPDVDLVELFHACIAAGFEGRYRSEPDGKRRMQDIMQQLYALLAHARAQATADLTPNWRGENAPPATVSFWGRILFAAAFAGGLLLLVFLLFWLLLIGSSGPPRRALDALMPAERLTLARDGGPQLATQDAGQTTGLKKFLEREIADKLVVVEQDANTVRVRTTVGTLFETGSDILVRDREPLFRRIAEAVDKEPGTVLIEGHADSSPISSIAFPDNLSLSAARARTISRLFASILTDPARIKAEGFGDKHWIASNDTPEGRALNRRVEIVIPRHD